MRILYFFLIFFLFSCRSTEQATENLRVDGVVKKLNIVDSSKIELNNNVLNLNFDSLKVKVATPVLSSEEIKDTKGTKVVETTIYGGSLNRAENSAVAEQTVSADSIHAASKVNRDSASAEEIVTIGKPPNMFFIYLIIVGAILLFLYFKFK